MTCEILGDMSMICNNVIMLMSFSRWVTFNNLPLGPWCGRLRSIILASSLGGRLDRISPTSWPNPLGLSRVLRVFFLWSCIW